MTEVRVATADDLPAVCDTLDAAAQWLLDQGIHQWPNPYPRAPVEEACATGALWVAVRDDRIVATMRTLRRDPEIWGDDPLPALYVHGLASHRDPVARGSGGALLRWAAATAAADGLVALRLDCWAGNGRLRRFYRDAGFRHVDDVEQRAYGTLWHCSRFELDLGVSTAGPRPGR